MAGSGLISLNGTETTAGISELNNQLSFVIGDLVTGQSGYVLLSGQVKAGTIGNNVRNQAELSGTNFTAIYTNTTTNHIGELAVSPTPVPSPTPTPSPIATPSPSPTATPVTSPTPQPTPTASPTPSPPATPTPLIQPSPPPPAQPTPSPIQPVPSPVVPPSPSPSPELKEITVAGSLIEAIREKFLDNPVVEESSQAIITPIILALAILNTIPTALLLTSYLLMYLHLIFLEPLLWLFRKKRKKWGIVYDALSKKPVDLAVVRLYRQKDKKLVQTKVTDKEGRYILMAKEPGKYYLTVEKPGYTYPTKYLREEKQDIKYLDLYHGEAIEVTEEKTAITANIPLDPVEKGIMPIKTVIRHYSMNNLRLIVSYVGMTLAALIVLIYPTVITIGALIIHILLYLLFRRLIVPPKPKSWGIVYDEKTKQPLRHAIVRIFDLRFKKLLEVQVTDKKGRYAFLVGKNQYQLLSEKPGYAKREVSPVDLISQEQIIDLDIGLQKAK